MREAGGTSEWGNRSVDLRQCGGRIRVRCAETSGATVVLKVSDNRPVVSRRIKNFSACLMQMAGCGGSNGPRKIVGD